MEFIGVFGSLFILAAYCYGLIHAQETQMVNCASCFRQKWEWTSWQCDIHCDTNTSPYGDIDAFSVGLIGEADTLVAATVGQIFKWDKIYLNVQNSYNTQTGKFVVRVPGIYSTTVHVFSPSSTHSAQLTIYVNRAGGGGEERLCDAHSVTGHHLTMCTVDLELNKDDELYTKAYTTGFVLAPTNMFFSSFKANILYRKLK